MKYSIHKGGERYEKNFDEVYLLDIGNCETRDARSQT